MSQDDARVDLCALIAQSAAHSGRRVDVLAKIRGASHYAAVMYDEGCSESVVALDIPARLQGRADVDEVMKRVWAGYPQPSAKATQIEVSGTFEFVPDEVPSRYIVVRSLRLATPEPHD
ncbi:hypothetical protein J5226_24650 [Lysobacter sp. K5869]|uniref:hypothetical protein n=1 Tax=Lysobacter sp. K5869 TaxID=2820808 RepID=UPI001C063EFF|nr:hypothetical protein [Lysobacter sp. K5869]QWP76725.1 hypothetical protein J5226_24650 [Lysobacter sp. K5869]